MDTGASPGHQGSAPPGGQEKLTGTDRHTIRHTEVGEMGQRRTEGEKGGGESKWLRRNSDEGRKKSGKRAGCQHSGEGKHLLGLWEPWGGSSSSWCQRQPRDGSAGTPVPLRVLAC